MLPTLLTLCGWTGSICLALCAAPQALKTIRTKKTDDISSAFLTLWTAGEVLTLLYILPQGPTPLLLNYAANIAFLFIICYYKFIHKKKEK